MQYPLEPSRVFRTSNVRYLSRLCLFLYVCTIMPDRLLIQLGCGLRSDFLPARSFFVLVGSWSARVLSFFRAFCLACLARPFFARRFLLHSAPRASTLLPARGVCACCCLLCWLSLFCCVVCCLLCVLCFVVVSAPPSFRSFWAR